MKPSQPFTIGFEGASEGSKSIRLKSGGTLRTGRFHRRLDCYSKVVAW